MKKLIVLLLVLVMLVPSNLVFAEETDPIEMVGPAIRMYPGSISVETIVQEYQAGSYFDHSCIKVKVTFITESSDGFREESEKLVEDYTTNLDGIPLSTDMTEITISYGDLSITIPIVVKEKVSKGIPILPDDMFVLASEITPTITKAKSKLQTITVRFTKIENAINYEIQICKNKKFKKNVTAYFPTKNIVKLPVDKKGTYYIRVRSLVGITTSEWSTVKKVKVK